jgi:hypothetical protein
VWLFPAASRRGTNGDPALSFAQMAPRLSTRIIGSGPTQVRGLAASTGVIGPFIIGKDCARYNVCSHFIDASLTRQVLRTPLERSSKRSSNCRARGS